MEEDGQQSIQVYCIDGVKTIPLNQMLPLTLKQCQEYVCSLLGFSNYVFLYRFPLSPSGRLAHLRQDLSLEQIMEEVGQVCFTHCNPQHIEQHSFHDDFPLGENNILLTLQHVSEEGVFLSEKFKVSAQNNINFITHLANRYSGTAFVTYYNLHVPLSDFAKTQLIEDALASMIWQRRQLVINIGCREQSVSMRNQKYLNTEHFVIIQSRDINIVVPKEANKKQALSIIRLVYGQFAIASESRNQDRPRSTVHPLAFKMAFTIFIGTTTDYLLFLESSNQLHIFSAQPPFSHINSVLLHSQPSRYLDQDIPILLEDSLIMYSITKKVIVHQHYGLPEGNLTHTRWFKWPGLGFEISTLDLIAFREKENSNLTIMNLSEPDELKMELDWFTSYKLHAGRVGRNNFSDKSHHFGLTFHNMVTIGDLRRKCIVLHISLNNFMPQEIIFNHLTQTIVISQRGEKSAQVFVRIDIKTGEQIERRQVPNKGKPVILSNGEQALINQGVMYMTQSKSPIRFKQSVLLEGTTFFTADQEYLPTTYTSITQIFA